jgi:hypothetical protein
LPSGIESAPTQQIDHVDIVLMRAIPVAPTNVEPDLLGRDVGDRDVDRINMKGHTVKETLQRLIAEHNDPLHREVGCIQL